MRRSGSAFDFSPRGGGNVCAGFFNLRGNAESKRGSVRQDEAHTLPGRMYSGMQAVPHCYAGQGLFRAEGRAADGCNPPDGA